MFTAACFRKGQGGFRGYAFIANEEGKAIAVVDLAAFSVTQKIPIEGEPTAVISHPVRPVIYALTPRTGTLHEIDIETMRVSRKVQAAPTAMAMRITPDASALWVLSRDSRRLVRVAVDSFKTDAHVALPMEPANFDLANSTGLCAVSYGEAGSIGIVELSSRRITAQVRIGSSVGAVRFRQDGNALLIANTGDRMLSVLEMPGAKVVANLPLAVRPDNLCFSPDGGQLFITGEGMDVVVVIFPYRIPEVKETVLAGRAPAAMCASQRYLFITNPAAGDVSILDIKTRKVIAVTAVGAEPSFVVMTPGEQYALVLNRKSGDMAVIRLGAIDNDRTKRAPLFTMISVGSKPVSAVVRRT
ncbi:MAG: hypothetical protein ABJF23_20855 [Bryobacteraceae bacterium]